MLTLTSLKRETRTTKLNDFGSLMEQKKDISENFQSLENLLFEFNWHAYDKIG